MHKSIICGMTLDELTCSLEEYGIDPSYAVKIAYWVYKKRIREISEITNISNEIKKLISDRFIPGLLAPVDIQRSPDKTEKFLFFTSDRKSFETVYLPESRRQTICVSTQSGCRMGCTFCQTGKNEFIGNLSAGEMVNQIISQPQAAEITHVVFMGMGEPMDNINEVIKACNIITAEWGLSLSSRNVTVSTVGITEGIIEFLEKSKCNIAFSLYSPFPGERREVIPAERSYPFHEIINILNSYHFTTKRRFSVAYMMINNINDTDKHFYALRDLLQGTKIKVNLIPYNITPDSCNIPSTPERMHFFKHNLIISGIPASIRKTRGNDISAACGMLAARYDRQTNR
jgi:23S rRNA (adenine2503-C2)-methyltransferase